MATIYCEHHAQVPARWRCAECHKNLCVQCAPKNLRGDPPNCPTCKNQLQSLGMSNVIKPFWQRIPRFFQYPAKLGPLMVALGLAVLSLGQMLPLLIAVPVAIAVAVYSVRYCYRVLYFTALGNLEPPELHQGGDTKGMFWRQVVLFMVLFGGVGLLGALTRSPGVLVFGAIGVALLAPAAIMTLAVEGSLLAALNPLRLVFVAVSIGWPYLLLWVMLLLLFGGQSQVMMLLVGKLPPAALQFLSTFVSVYFSIAMFHMMGYVVYQYHEALGFHAQKEYTESAEAAQDLGKLAAVAPALDPVQMLISEGRFDAAEAELVKQLEAAPEDLKLHDRYNRLILTVDHGDGRGASHADLYIGKLLAQKQRDKALDVYRRALARWKALEVKDGDDAVALARHATERNDPKLVLPLLARFAQRFPGHAALPEAQLLSAQALAHGMGKDQMALQIVEQLRRAHPEHPLRPQMDALHSTLTRLVARQAAGPAAPPRPSG